MTTATTSKKTTGKKGASKKVATTAVPAYNADLLRSIVEATNAGSFVYTSITDHTPLITEGLVEINPALVDDAGNIATRATQKGIDAQTQGKQEMSHHHDHKHEEVAATAAVASVTPAAFAIEDNVPVPTAIRRGGKGGNVYPFEQLAVGQSFFVPASDAKPNPAKSLASTVSSATKRYADSDKRKFIVRSVEGGARVWRIE